MKKFRFLEDIATADVAFEAYGKTPSELFENAGLALEEVMVDTKTISRSKIKNLKLKLESGSLEDLLFDFLSELVFLKDRDGLLFSKIKVKIFPDSGDGRRLNQGKQDEQQGWKDEEQQKRGNGEFGFKGGEINFKLKAELFGETINPHHHLRTDVKAVTKHLFGIEKVRDSQENSKIYKATVVLDI